MSALKRKTDIRTAAFEKSVASGKPIFNSVNRGKGPKGLVSSPAAPSPEATEGKGYKPSRERTENQILTEKADRLFSIRVRRAYDWTCARCGDEARHEKDRWRFECAHVVRRSFGATRWLDGAAVCLCHGCHVYMTRRPLEWKAFLLTLGIDFDAFLVVARHGHVPKVADVIPLLKSGAGYQTEGDSLSHSSPAEVGH